MRVLYLVFSCLAAVTAYAQTTVATYNIRYANAHDGVNAWSNRKDSVVALINTINPDILGTQEVLNSQYTYLKRALKNYHAYGVGRNNGKRSGEYCAVFFRKDKYEAVRNGTFWLSQTPAVPGSKSWDAAITRICTWVLLREKKSGESILVLNTHFDHKGKEARRNSATLLRKMIDSLAGSYPVIVTGDFNFKPTDAAYTTLTETQGHTVPLADSYSPGATPYTCCGFDVKNNDCSRIDYLYHSLHYRATNYTVHTHNNGQYYPSDHLPVSVVLTLVDPR